MWQIIVCSVEGREKGSGDKCAECSVFLKIIYFKILAAMKDRDCCHMLTRAKNGFYGVLMINALKKNPNLQKAGYMDKFHEK